VEALTSASADDLPLLGELIAESARIGRGITVHGNVIVTAAGLDIAVHQPALPPPMR
jgi:hypothetical protein